MTASFFVFILLFFQLYLIIIKIIEGINYKRKKAMIILTPDEIRRAEAEANASGLSYEEMMEKAGMGCAGHILKSYPGSRNIVILAGKGKNGGDGFVIARGLSEAGKKVDVLCMFSSPSDELSEKNKRRIQGVAEIHNASVITKSIVRLIENADVIVDAVFGIGFKGSLPGNIKELFGIVNKQSSVKIAIDIPSGLSSENEYTDDSFNADETLSMLCFKKEHVYKPFSSRCGRVTVIPIGFDAASSGRNALSVEDARRLLPERPFDSHKGTFGKAMLVAGSYSMPGAGIIAAKGCLSSGAGLTYFAFPDRIYNTVTSHLCECVFTPLPSSGKGGFSAAAFDCIADSIDSYDALALGPGITRDSEVKEFAEKIIKNYKGKLIIDADGINIVSENINLLKESKADILLTPHPAEMGRLNSLTAKEINADREEIALSFAKKYGVTLLLKGANTVVADKSGEIFINPTGSSALSRGGSGDLLTGIALSLAAQGLSLRDSAVLAAFLHGLAGEKAEEKYTAYAASTENIHGCIPEALSSILRGK